MQGFYRNYDNSLTKDLYPLIKTAFLKPLLFLLVSFRPIGKLTHFTGLRSAQRRKRVPFTP